MANKPKLVYSALTLANLKTTSGFANIEASSSNDYYYSVIFTSDGYIVTHGQKFKTVMPQSITAGTYGYYNNYTAKIPIITVNADGIITGISLESNAVHLDYVTTTKETTIDNLIYLTGKSSADPTNFGAEKISDEVYIKYRDTTQGDENNHPTTLYVPNIIVNGNPISTIIEQQIISANAMVYKGTYNALNVATNSSVDTSKFTPTPSTSSLGWTWRVEGTGYFGNIAVEPGDVIISHDANPGATVGKYDVILANLSGAVTANSNFNNNTLVYATGAHTLSSITNPSDNSFLAYYGSEANNKTLLWKEFATFTITDGTNSVVYNPFTQQSVKLAAGSNTTLSYSSTNNTFTFASSYTNNTYNIITSDSNDGTTENSGTEIANSKFLNLITSTNGSSWSTIKSLELVGSDGIIAKAFNGLLKFGLDLANADLSDKNYRVLYDSGTKKLYVNVPWTDTNTWRPVWAYQITSGTNGNSDTSAGGLIEQNTYTKQLAFGSEFAWIESDGTNATNTSEIHLVWADVSSTGVISYHV